MSNITEEQKKALQELFKDAMAWGKSYGNCLNLSEIAVSDVSGQYVEQALKALSMRAATPRQPAQAPVLSEADERAAFEARARKSGYSLRRDGDEYKHPPTQHAWQGWSMSTETRPTNLKSEPAATFSVPEGPTNPGWYVVLPPDFDEPTVRAFGKDGQWWIPLGKGNGDDGWMTGREYQNWVGPIADIEDRQPFLPEVAAPAAAHEPAAQERIAELEAELADMEAARDEALNGPWESWAAQVLKLVRECSGYDGSDGVNIVEEVQELIDEFNRADKPAVSSYEWLAGLECNSLHVSRNGDHACNYMTAEQWIDDYPDNFEDVAPEEIAKMKATNTIWRLQIYPNTPVGFNFWHGATIDAAIKAAMADYGITSESGKD